MEDVPDDVSMKLRDDTSRPLASRAVAIAMAEAIILDQEGAAALEAQRPLDVEEAPDRWIIKGQAQYAPMAPPFQQSLQGPVELAILKRNCRVVRYMHWVTIGPPD